MLKKVSESNPADLHSFKHHWPNIKPLVKRLISNKPIGKQDWQDLFYTVHLICSWDEKGCQRLFKALQLELVGSIIHDFRNKLFTIEDGQQQLKEYVDCWKEFSEHCQRFPVAFQQLDLATRRRNPPAYFSTKNIAQASLHKRQSESTVRCMMLTLWDQYIVQGLFDRLQSSALKLLLAEREGHIIDPQLITVLRESLRLMDHHTCYSQNFELKYIKDIEIFYSSRASDRFKEDGLISYISWSMNQMDLENRRAELYMQAESVATMQVSEVLVKVLVANFVEQVLVDSSRFIRSNDTDNMKLIFNFVDKVEGFTTRFLEEVGRHIITTGLSYLIASTSVASCSCEKYVEKLIEMYDQFGRIIQQSFGDDKRARSILDKAFETIVNDTRVFRSQFNVSSQNTPGSEQCSKDSKLEFRCPELLSNYCDLLFRKSSLSRKLTPTDLDNRLKEVLQVIRFISNKDAFIKHHKFHLNRRLLLNASLSIEKEEQFVNDLKELPGVHVDYLNKLMRMFKDLKSSEVLQQQFRKNLQQTYQETNNINNNNNIVIQTLVNQLSEALTLQDNNNKTLRDPDSLNFKILNPVAWSQPTDKSSIAMPEEISHILPNFETFFTDQNNGRKLDWYHQLSYGTITLSSNKGKFDLDITAYQLSILSTFNHQAKSSKTLKELEIETGLNVTELKRSLWSLVANPKLKIQLIVCKPEIESAKDLERETNSFSINQEFAIIKNGKIQPKGRVSLIGRLPLMMETLTR